MLIYGVAWGWHDGDGSSSLRASLDALRERSSTRSTRWRSQPFQQSLIREWVACDCLVDDTQWCMESMLSPARLRYTTSSFATRPRLGDVVRSVVVVYVWRFAVTARPLSYRIQLQEPEHRGLVKPSRLGWEFLTVKLKCLSLPS